SLKPQKQKVYPINHLAQKTCRTVLALSPTMNAAPEIIDRRGGEGELRVGQNSKDALRKQFL
ncbi:MAG: hypothetical protein KDA88_23515, partial [Planctomycetaceae bacterium]|nr:hypothetical protein [Planctomycetaceae bacterium]